MKAELIINGPKGQAFAEVYMEPDSHGDIHPAFAEQALAYALNLYNELPEPSPCQSASE